MMNYRQAKQLAVRIAADGLEGKHPLMNIRIRQFDLSGYSYGRGRHTVEVSAPGVNAPVIFEDEEAYAEALFEAVQVERSLEA